MRLNIRIIKEHPRCRALTDMERADDCKIWKVVVVKSVDVLEVLAQVNWICSIAAEDGIPLGGERRRFKEPISKKCLWR